ncbi:hypothetical protein CGCS363_v008118 [Colletotrichum siamense]|uniref:uncharacterized protein n=1 Tax=Colletotrichum siamense TaxID=690259 RepID=UPI001872A45F|nr:uncharacterized protein CGCS363_v008118 [Colletotrichum siamense]KAF5496942.1 hypothetical protein CGCS363_v008118 [Colletotrichum siamense]
MSRRHPPTSPDGPTAAEPLLVFRSKPVASYIAGRWSALETAKEIPRGFVHALLLGADDGTAPAFGGLKCVTATSFSPDTVLAERDPHGHGELQHNRRTRTTTRDRPPPWRGLRVVRAQGCGSQVPSV